ncbi:FHA domain-containing protein [Roseobacter sp.]|uniref:FHA domain-containing protein n=1 Tax=Roseobacter sp. TaxID=1907202 RepID=UPI00385B9CBB
MTLFRKVFQNQSTPATSDNGLDDEALRAAFMETSDHRVLPLDPFVVAEEAERLAAGNELDANSDLMGQLGFIKKDKDHLQAHSKAEQPIKKPETTEHDSLVASDNLSEDLDKDDDAANIAAVLAQTNVPEPAPNLRNKAGEVQLEPTADLDETEESAAEIRNIFADETVSKDSAVEPTSREEAPVQDSNPALVAFAQKQLQELNGGGKNEARAEASAPVDLSEPSVLSSVPDPVAGRAGRRAGRVKTRMLGFNPSEPSTIDPIGNAQNATAKPQNGKFPVGWLIVVEGPGAGHSFTIFRGASMIGRGDDQVIKLDFGDNSISRCNHAAIAYDDEENKFYIGHGGKSNIIRRNARPVLSTEELHHADLLRIGETTLRFVALCGTDFQWDMTGGGDAPAV